jgi:hypothetical protein
MGDARSPRIPHPRERLAAFPGPVAVAGDATRWGPVASLEAHGLNGQPWAIDIVYQDGDGQHQLVVKTIRSRDGLNPRGLPVENAAIQLHNFLRRAETQSHPELYRHHSNQGTPPPAPDADVSASRYAHIQASVAQALSTETDIAIGDTMHRARRIDALNCAVIEAQWNGQTVFITGWPDTMGAPSLRSAIPTDVDHL